MSKINNHSLDSTFIFPVSASVAAPFANKLLYFKFTNSQDRVPTKWGKMFPKKIFFKQYVLELLYYTNTGA